MVSAEISFTTEQLSLIERTGSQYVDACPGAGKTQAIAERFIRRPNSHPRKGVALLSFTNAAIDEVRARCAGTPELLRSPNFVGTIDKFINRFIVTPVQTTLLPTPIKFVDVWSQLPHTAVKAKDISGKYALEWFEFDQNHKATLKPERAPWKRRSELTSLDGWKVTRLEESATALYKRLLVRGYHDATSARRAALSYLADGSRRAALTALLAARFSEIIVDEAQDCSDEDVLILQWVKAAGPHLVLVGDPDQSIFEFRNRSTGADASLQALVPRGTRLTGNFRSTPAICQVANSLRSSSNSVDKAVGQHRSSTQPVLVFRYTKPKQVEKTATKIAAAEGFTFEQCVVLAHGADKAAACAGGATDDDVQGARLPRIAAAVECLRSASSASKRRRDALTDLSICLHESAQPAIKELQRQEFLQAVGMTQREHDAELLRVAFAVTLDRSKPPAVFKTSLLSTLSEFGIDWVRSDVLRAPATWPTKSTNKPPLFEHATIHGYKGLQRDFVVVVIPDHGKREPDQTGAGQWCSDTAGEPRRVLYVGATRAAQMLLLAVHENVFDQVCARLNSDGVPFEVIES